MLLLTIIIIITGLIIILDKSDKYKKTYIMRTNWSLKLRCQQKRMTK